MGTHLWVIAKHHSTPHGAVMFEGFREVGGWGGGLTWTYIMPRDTSLSKSQGNFFSKFGARGTEEQ